MNDRLAGFEKVVSSIAISYSYFRTSQYEFHKQQILSSGYINADETGIRVQDDDKKGKTHKGFYWVYHSQELKPPCSTISPGEAGKVPIMY